MITNNAAGALIQEGNPIESLGSHKTRLIDMTSWRLNREDTPTAVLLRV